MLGWSVALDRLCAAVSSRSMPPFDPRFMPSLSLPEKRNRSFLATAHGCTQHLSSLAAVGGQQGRFYATFTPIPWCNSASRPPRSPASCVLPNVVAENGSIFFSDTRFARFGAQALKKRQPREAAGAWMSAKSTSAYASATSSGSLRALSRCLCDADRRSGQSATCATASAPERR